MSLSFYTYLLSIWPYNGHIYNLCVCIADQVVQLSGKNAKERSNDRSRKRTEAKKAGEEPAQMTAMADPPPRICNRVCTAWSNPPAACDCVEVSKWIGKHKHEKLLVQEVSRAVDVNGKTWKRSDDVSYWRPGARGAKHFYNAVVVGLWKIRFPSGTSRTLAQLN